MPKLVIVESLERKEPIKAVPEPEEKPRKRATRGWMMERAKTGRSTCKQCKKNIDRGEFRIGVITFYPHKNIKWYHVDCSDRWIMGVQFDDFWYKKQMDEDMIDTLKMKLVELNGKMTIMQKMPEIVGALDMPRFMTAITSRYDKFRGFRFGLPENLKYGKNWRWRCFLATMLVCNTHETAMLAFINKLFTVYQNPEALEKLRGDKVTTKAWMDFGDKIDLRHVGKKMAFILRANKKLIDDHDGDVPKDRETLQSMSGVGRHVASITMAWCHQEPEFGIDVHVKRILERWGYIKPKMSDIEIEEKVKEIIPRDKVGHFSRAFVDHGQQVCGYTPNCDGCYLRGSCPTAAKYLDW